MEMVLLYIVKTPSEIKLVSEGERSRSKERYAKIEAMKHVPEKGFDDLRNIALGCVPFTMLLARLVIMASPVRI